MSNQNTFDIKHWHPSLLNIFPLGCFGNFFFLYYWFFFRFAKKKYSVWLVYDGDKVIHHSVVFPYSYKFPFMSKESIQVGMIYTDIAYRNRNIASNILSYIINNNKNHDIWYVVENSNTHSIKLAEKTGFEFYAKAYKRKFFYQPTIYKLIDK